VVGSFCHDQVVDAEPLDQVVDPASRDQVVEATGRDQVVDAAGRDQVVDATGLDRGTAATRAFTQIPLARAAIPISAMQNDVEGALWVFMVPPPCADGGGADSAAAVGEYVC